MKTINIQREISRLDHRNPAYDRISIRGVRFVMIFYGGEGWNKIGKLYRQIGVD
ncbi:MAG: hypothetical protein OXG56_08460 [Gammaproteobacteria bacterium]|nr:hypothetical protein [Gammaproteobacteria bacterium]